MQAISDRWHWLFSYVRAGSWTLQRSRLGGRKAMEPWWKQISDVVVAEFADLGNLAEVTRTVIRLTVASVLGAVLGFERESRGKAAGVKTHMLVSLGAAIFVLVPHQAGVLPAEMTRVIQGIVSGIGFIGAGAILKSQATNQIHGLTTAAGIWMTAAIGVAAGLGHEGTAVICTLLALVVFAIMPKLVALFDTPDHANSDAVLPNDKGRRVE